MSASTRVGLLALWCLVLVSAVGVVWSKQQSRNQFVELQRLEKERDQLDTEWGQLRLEQSTWVTYGRIEKIAHDDLRMVVPDPNQVHLIEQP
ncbi:MAG: cell division protein FtsL [Steroidobacteraceae bacterium]